MHLNSEEMVGYKRFTQDMVHGSYLRLKDMGQFKLSDLGMKVQLDSAESDANSPGYNIYWGSREGRVEVAVMEDDHLLNTLRYCIVNYEATKHSKIPELQSINGKSFEEWIDIFTQEYYYRKEKAKQQEIAKLRAEYEELKSREEKKADVVAKLKELGVEV